MKPMSLLDEALEAWADARRGVMAELRNIPERRIDFRPAPGGRSVAELAQHIIESGLMWSGELTNPHGDFQRKSFQAFIKEYAPRVQRNRTRSALLRLLRSSHREGERRFRTLGAVGLLQQIRRFDGERWTRLTWLHHGIAHEEYHRAQLALCGRLLGRTPALTRLIHGT